MALARCSAVLSAALLACAALAPVRMRAQVVTVSASAPAAADAPAYVPHRVYDARRGRFTDLEAMAADASGADAAFFGEEHDDPGTHRMERALLEAVARRRGRVVVSMEMFERDVQPLLGAYLAGRVGEDSLRAAGRPWPRYASDYRPLVGLARERGWPVVAANVPRPLAAAVAREGLGALDRLPPEHRAWAARDIECPADAYRTRFLAAFREMGPGASHGAGADSTLQRYYLAQCVKDETMAESIAGELERGGAGTLVVHFNGGFHSDFRQGTVARVHRRLPGARIVTITAIPARDLDRIHPGTDRRRADYLLYTLAPPDSAAAR